MLATSLTILLFIGLATYVISLNPRHSISWIFSTLCLTIAGNYLSSLFMVSEGADQAGVLPLALRLKWVFTTLSPTLFLHLLFYYFPPYWQSYKAWILSPAYFCSLFFALLIFGTGLIIAGPVYRPVPHIAGPLPGPLMPALAGFFLGQIILGSWGLIVSYRLTPSHLLRHQIFYLLIPTSLIIAGSTLHWLDLLTRDTVPIPHELPDLLLIVAAVLYARTVVRYGSFIGQPLGNRTLFYSVLAVIFGLLALYIADQLDHFLMSHMFLPYPVVTGILVIILVAGYPAISRWITKRFDGWLFKSAKQQQEYIRYLAEALSQTPSTEQLQAELLDTLCKILDVDCGYVALSNADLPPHTAITQVVHGYLNLKPGDLVQLPTNLNASPRPQIFSGAANHFDAGGKNPVLFCRLVIENENVGVLALGEKRDGRLFTRQELALCSQLAGQFNTVGRMMRVSQQRNQYLEAARNQSRTLEQLSRNVIASTRQTLVRWETVEPAPIEICALGPLQLRKNGRWLSENEWGSEKAKLLLAYLIWKSPRGATREELSEALWPERPFEETANVFHVTLHRLRRVLQPKTGTRITTNYIVHDRGYYRFNTAAPHWLDITAFESLATATDLDALRAAVELYRGCYLEDTAWALPPDVEARQRRLEQMYADVLRRLCVQLDGRQATPYLEKLLAVEPVDETAYRALILGYLAQGRRDLARRYIVRWQQALEELTLEPTQEIISLWETVNKNSIS